MSLIFKTSPLPHFNDRPNGSKIDTLVVHSIYAPDAGEMFNPEVCIKLLDENKVSPHYTIDRTGLVWQHVDESKRAWHAGVSRMCLPDDARENVNDFSLGIELIGQGESNFAEAQYSSLVELTSQIMSRHPIRNITGHQHIAPGRKADPGPNFDWVRYRQMLSDFLGISPAITFPIT